MLCLVLSHSTYARSRLITVVCVCWTVSVSTRRRLNTSSSSAWSFRLSIATASRSRWSVRTSWTPLTTSVPRRCRRCRSFCCMHVHLWMRLVYSVVVWRTNNSIACISEVTLHRALSVPKWWLFAVCIPPRYLSHVIQSNLASYLDKSTHQTVGDVVWLGE